MCIRDSNYPRHDRAGWKVRLETTKDAIWAMLMPVILLGGILSGVFTPTEASIVTCVYALVVGVFVYKEIQITDVPRIVWENIRACASIIVLIGLANVFAYILTAERIPQMVANSILSITDNRIVVILLINVVLLFVGMFMESLAAILITFPVLLPVATAVGMEPVHFARMAILNLIDVYKRQVSDRAVPEIPAKIMEAMMLAYAMPPVRCPTSLSQKSISLSEMPPWFIRLPASVKPGIHKREMCIRDSLRQGWQRLWLRMGHRSQDPAR